MVDIHDGKYKSRLSYYMYNIPIYQNIYLTHIWRQHQMTKKTTDIKCNFKKCNENQIYFIFLFLLITKKKQHLEIFFLF